jgi:antiviral defense system Shedu protein SduA
MAELDEFGELLRARAALSEAADILPFFRERRHLSALLGSYHPNLIGYDRIAYELRLFGAFVADLVVGDSRRGSFCLVEFEDADPTSIFAMKPTRGTREWAARLERGFSQIIDWFWIVRDLERSQQLGRLFGVGQPDASGLLVIGRDADLTPDDRARLEWRRKHVPVDSRHVHICTYDELERDLRDRLLLARLARGMLEG